MTESQEIHQIEYRWQPTKDMSAVASSMSSESARLWVQRIGPWVRHPGVDAPTESVRYEVLGGRAVLAWRQRDRQAFEFEDGLEGRPLVSRVLVGAADLLTPEVAIAVCYAGLPEAIGPRPGTVAAGSSLPPVDAAGLTGLARGHADALDQAAAQENGLERVVAAALSERDTPLSVQLPERFILRSPRTGSQALLLWGLRRTVWPLLGRGGRRGWSFSTFELPLSDMDPETLPDIVFRLAQATPQAAPTVIRKEVRVRPQDPVAPPTETMPQHLASLLVAAYQDRGGDELSQLITAWSGDHLSADRRIQAVYDALVTSLVPGTAVSEGTGNAPVQEPVATAPDDNAETARLVASPTAIPAASPQPAESAVRPESRQPEPVRLLPVDPPLPVPSPSTVSSGRSPESAPRLFADESQHRPAFADESQHRPATEAPGPAALSDLLELLSAGAASHEAEDAFQALRAQNFRSGPHDRAIARKVICDHGWYVDVFDQNDQGQFEDILMMIFLHTVVPDLAERQVTGELAYWVDKLAAPAAVIRALYATTDAAADKRQLMDQALRPAMARRWMNENGIHVPPAAQAPPAPAPPAPVPPVASPPAPAPQVAPPQARHRTSSSGDGRPGARGAAAAQAMPRRPDGTPAVQGLLNRKISVRASLVLAVCVAAVVLLLLTLS